MVFTTFLSWSRSILAFGTAVVDFFSTSVSEATALGDVVLPDAIANLSMFEFFTGGGIVFVLSYSLISWFVDVLP